ncbi:unnamed protein product, partial [Ectocarpus fasciculatus]
MISVTAYKAGGGGAEQQEVKPEPAESEPAAARRIAAAPRVRRRKDSACVPRKAATAGKTPTTTTKTATVGFVKVEPREQQPRSSTNHGETDVVRVAARAAGVGEPAASRTEGLLPTVRQGRRPARSTNGGGGSKMADTPEKAHADESNVVTRGGGGIRERDDGDGSETNPGGEDEEQGAAADNVQPPPPRKGGVKLVVAGVRTDDGGGAGVQRRPSDRCTATDDGGGTRNASRGFPRSSSDVCSNNRRALRLNPERQSLRPDQTCGAPRVEEAAGGNNSGGGGGVSGDRVLGKRCAGSRVALQGAGDGSERRHARKKAKRADVYTISDVDGGGGGSGGGVDCGQPVSKKEVNVLGVPNPGSWGEGGADEKAGWRFPTVVFDGECFQG